MRTCTRGSRTLSLLAVVSIIATFLVLPSTAWAHTADAEGNDKSEDRAVTTAPQQLQPDPERGVVFDGLRRNPAGRCGAHGFELSTETDGLVECSHGPDPAPEGIDVRVSRPPVTVAPTDIIGRLHGEIDARRVTPPVTETGAPAAATADSNPAPSATAEAGGNTVTNYPGQIRCSGEGYEGYRTQVIYAHAADRAQRYWTYRDSIKTWSREADKVFDNSAAETGGERHLRFVTYKSGSGCELSVAYAKLSNAGDDNFSNTINELRGLGFNRSDRKYLVFMDANVYCGIGQIYGDDRPGTENWNDGHISMFSRVDAGCWGISGHSVEAHELMHNFGGVQQSAPYRTPGWHCWDEYDLMCYNDGSGYSMVTYCSDAAHNNRFDCDHDTYYHTNPPSGSYLATKWNAARSRFLIRCGWYYTTWTGWFYACTS